MDEKDLSKISLEDILKEFGDPQQPEDPEQEARQEEAFTPAQKIIPEEVLQEEEAEFDPDDVRVLKEDVQVWDGKAPLRKSKKTAIPGDTVRLDEITRAVKKQEAANLGETARFAPVGGDALPVDEPPVTVAPEEKVEPYSQEWEPEYEQPIRDYVPQEPIIFRPKSRLQELKRKLIEGPEKRYYELSEQGLGKLQLAILMNLVVALLSAGATAMYAMGAVPEDRTRLLVFGQFLALLLSGLFGSYQLIEGVQDLLHRRFTLNTLLVFTLLACCVDAVICLRDVRVPCCAAFSLSMTMSLWSAYQKRNTEMGQMDTMRKAIRLDSLVSAPDFYEGKQGFLRAEGQVEDFMDNYQTPSGAERALSVYALAVLAVSLAAGIVAGTLHNVYLGIQVFSVSLLMAVPASSHITLSRPMALLERRLHKLGTVLCGWDGVLGLSKPGAFPLVDTDLFPAGSIKMNGVKFYGSKEPDEVIAYAAALIGTDGGAMAELFTQLLDSRSGYHYEVTGMRSYPNGGIGGEVNGDGVLAGTLSFMQEMGVDMPKGTRVNQAIYVSINGDLSGVFAVALNKTKAAAAGLTTLCAYRGLTPVMTVGDFVLTENFLRSKFGVNTRRMAFPEREERCALAKKEPEADAQALALMTKDGLAGMAFAVTGARALRSACRAGAAVHLIGGIAGLLMMLALAVVGAAELLTPANVLLYQLIWMVPGLLITEWTRSV